MKLQNNLWLRTRTVRYFLNLYNRATIRGAVEAAAQKEREVLLAGFQDYCQIPVDVEGIAKSRRVHIASIIRKPADEDGNIIPMENGAFMEVNPDRAEFRKRFTIAHEIGHTLFHEGKEHQIGILDKKEMQAEETICFMFARALLMPAEHIRRFVQQIPNGTPIEILGELERARRKFKVSLPALILRIGEIGILSSIPCIFLYLRYRKNWVTKSDEQLRVDICSSIGELSNLRIWPNRSVKGINLRSAEILFASWKEQLGENSEFTGGRYGLKPDGGIVRAAGELSNWIPEDINFSSLIRGKWHNEVIRMLTASFLYVRKGWTQKQAYIITLIKRPE